VTHEKPTELETETLIPEPLIALVKCKETAVTYGSITSEATSTIAPPATRVMTIGDPLSTKLVTTGCFKVKLAHSMFVFYLGWRCQQKMFAVGESCCAWSCTFTCTIDIGCCDPDGDSNTIEKQSKWDHMDSCCHLEPL